MKSGFALRKLAFVLGVFCATVLAMAVQKPVFLAYYAADAAQASVGEWLGVVWHGLTLDSTVAGYVTALPLLLTLVSLWVRLPAPMSTALSASASRLGLDLPARAGLVAVAAAVQAGGRARAQPAAGAGRGAAAQAALAAHAA